MQLFHPLKSPDILLLFVLCDSKLGLEQKTNILKMSPWALGTRDEHILTFYSLLINRLIHKVFCRRLDDENNRYLQPYTTTVTITVFWGGIFFQCSFEFVDSVCTAFWIFFFLMLSVSALVHLLRRYFPALHPLISLHKSQSGVWSRRLFKHSFSTSLRGLGAILLLNCSGVEISRRENVNSTRT